MQITAYYFRAHMYTMVPRHVREDMAWMADHGTKGVALAVLEQDLDHARDNIDIVAREAERAGMRLWAVPSRWCGLVAGAPKVPSIWGSLAPETWARQADGSPQECFGPTCSIHHPAVAERMDALLDRLLASWPFAGVVWDEPKCLGTDHSAMAKAVAGWRDDALWQGRATAAFFAARGARIAQRAAGCARSLFLHSPHARSPELLAAFAGARDLDEFGCDGRPFALGAGKDGRQENDKSLIDFGGVFLQAAHAHGKRGLFLIENHNMATPSFAAMDAGLPRVIAMRPEHLLYYYFPRAVDDPETAMAIVGKHLKAAAR